MKKREVITGFGIILLTIILNVIVIRNQYTNYPSDDDFEGKNEESSVNIIFNSHDDDKEKETDNQTGDVEGVYKGTRKVISSIPRNKEVTVVQEMAALPYDITNDGIVDDEDLRSILTSYGKQESEIPTNYNNPDVDNNGSINIIDYTYLLKDKDVDQSVSKGLPYVPGDIIVKVREGVSTDTIQGILEQSGIGDVSTKELSENTYLLKSPSLATVSQEYLQESSIDDKVVFIDPYLEHSLEVLDLDSAVEYAEPNYKIQITLTPNDQYFSRQWGLHNSSDDIDLNGPEGWDIETGSGDVVVAVIDTGIDYTHEDLSGNMWVNPGEIPGDGIDNDDNGYTDDIHGINSLPSSEDPMDDDGHGTHVAGIISARGNNGVGVSGVNWDTKLLACKACNYIGCYSSALIECLRYVRELKTRADNPVNVAVTSNSWALGNYSQSVYDEIEKQMEAGILFVVAAENYSRDNDLQNYWTQYDLPNIVSVAAMTSGGNLSGFSSYGKHTSHVVAPGSLIYSTQIYGGYEYRSGTSMATPYVSGIAGLLKAHDPTLDWISMRNLILAGGEDTPLLTDKVITGKFVRIWGEGNSGSLNCQNQVLKKWFRPARDVITASVGELVDLSAYNINCANPNGATIAEVLETGEQITLNDDGAGEDKVASDGLYYANWSAPMESGEYNLQLDTSEITKILALNPYLPPEEDEFSYRNITGQDLEMGDDEVGRIDTPFPIQLGDLDIGFDSVIISSNGFVSLLDEKSQFWNLVIPTNEFYVLIAPFWDNLDCSVGGGVYWDVIGDAPNRELVIEWREVPHKEIETRPPSPSTLDYDPTENITFQIVFTEGSSKVMFNYLDTTFGGESALFDDGNRATIGIQISKSSAEMYGFQQPILHDQLTLAWETAYTLPSLSMDYPVDGQVLDYDGSYLFRVQASDNVDLYEFSFYQNDILIHQGNSTNGEYGIHPEGGIHSRFEEGFVDVSIRASVDGLWTDTLSISIELYDSSPEIPPIVPGTGNPPEMVYPQDRQILDHGGSYMFKVTEIENARGYLFSLYQDNDDDGIKELIYQNWEHDGQLSNDGEFGVHPDNPYHSEFEPGEVEVVIMALVGDEWTQERRITIYLQNSWVAGISDMAHRFGMKISEIKLDPIEDIQR